MFPDWWILSVKWAVWLKNACVQWEIITAGVSNPSWGSIPVPQGGPGPPTSTVKETVSLSDLPRISSHNQFYTLLQHCWIGYKQQPPTFPLATCRQQAIGREKLGAALQQGPHHLANETQAEEFSSRLPCSFRVSPDQIWRIFLHWKRWTAAVSCTAEGAQV